MGELFVEYLSFLVQNFGVSGGQLVYVSTVLVALYIFQWVFYSIISYIRRKIRTYRRATPLKSTEKKRKAFIKKHFNVDGSQIKFLGDKEGVDLKTMEVIEDPRNTIKYMYLGIDYSSYFKESVIDMEEVKSSKMFYVVRETYHGLYGYTFEELEKSYGRLGKTKRDREGRDKQKLKDRKNREYIDGLKSRVRPPKKRRHKRKK